jgi:hypothetical protein
MHLLHYRHNLTVPRDTAPTFARFWEENMKLEAADCAPSCDVSALMDLFADDAVYVDATGGEIPGKENIAAHFFARFNFLTVDTASSARSGNGLPDIRSDCDPSDPAVARSDSFECPTEPGNDATAYEYWRYDVLQPGVKTLVNPFAVSSTTVGEVSVGNVVKITRKEDVLSF